MQKIASTHTQIFNRTGRQIIDSDQVQYSLDLEKKRTLTLKQILQGEWHKNCDPKFISSAEIHFDLDALVAMPRQTFPLGTVLSAKWIKVINLPKEICDGVTRISLKVTVVAVDKKERGKILASSNPIVLQSAAPVVGLGGNGALRPVPDENLGQEILKLSYDKDGPVIQYNKSLVNWGKVANNPHVMYTILSPILRQIYTKIAFEQDGHRWQETWLRYDGAKQHRVSLPKVKDKYSTEDLNQINEWVDDVVGSLSRHINLLDVYQKEAESYEKEANKKA